MARDTFNDRINDNDARESTPGYDRDITRLVKNVKDKRVSGSNLSDRERELINIEKMVKSINNVQASTNEHINNQARSMEAYFSTQDELQRKKYKKELRNAQKSYEVEVKFMKDYYKANSRFMDSEEKKNYRKRLESSKKTYKEEMKLMSRIYGDEFTNISRDMNKTLSSSMMGAFDDFSVAIRDLNVTAKLNDITKGIDAQSSSNITTNRELRVNTGLTKSQQDEIFESQRDFIDLLEGKINRTDLLPYTQKAYDVTGSTDPEILADTAESLLVTGKLFGDGATELADLARSLDRTGIKFDDKMEVFNDFAAEARRSGELSNINVADINTSINNLAPTLETLSGGDTDKMNRLVEGTYKTLTAASEIYGPGGVDVVSKIYEEIGKGANSSLFNNLGITSQEISNATETGDITNILGRVQEGLSNRGVYSNNTLVAQTARQELGISDSEANALGSMNMDEMSALDAAINDIAARSSGSAVDTLTSSNDLLESNIFTPMFNWMSNNIVPYVESFKDTMGISDSDLLGNVAEATMWLRVIAASDMFDKGKGIVSSIANFFGKGGGATGLIKGSKDAYTAGAAASAASGGGKIAQAGSGLAGSLSSTVGKGALGLSLAVDGLLGFFKSDQWGTSKISSVLGSVIGGTGSGIDSDEKWYSKLLNIGGNTLKGAGAGAVAGSVVPGVGNVVGAIGGGAAGLLSGLIGGERISKGFDWFGNLFKSDKDNVDSTEDNTKAINRLSEVLSNPSVDRWEDTKIVNSAKKNQHKDGLDTVPYDGYVATLHKDEAVLRADHAEMWRNTQRGASSSNYLEDAFTNATFSAESLTDTTAPVISSAQSGESGYVENSSQASSASDKDIWRWFRSAGYSPAATAGVMGNLYAESKLNPAAIQGGGSGPAAGIAQWENYNTKSMRWKKMSDHAKSKGKQWTDLTSQLQWIDKEMQGADPTTKVLLDRKVGGYSNFKSLSNVNKAALVFLESFERAGIPHMDRRYDSANGYYGRLSQYEQGTPWVPNTQLALLHKGEMVVPADQNPYNPSSSTPILSGGSDLGEVIQVVQWVGHYLGDILKSAPETSPWKSIPTPESNITGMRS